MKLFERLIESGRPFRAFQFASFAEFNFQPRPERIVIPGERLFARAFGCWRAFGNEQQQIQTRHRQQASAKPTAQRAADASSGDLHEAMLQSD